MNSTLQRVVFWVAVTVLAGFFAALGEALFNALF
jgi:hypothetical protein